MSASETVAVQEIGTGDYWVYYTPTAAATLYVLTIAPASALQTVIPTEDASTRAAEFQYNVETGYSASTGPYLTTRAAFKVAAKLSATDLDSAIDALLPQVTDRIQTLCGRTFAQATVTEYPQIKGNPLSQLFLSRPPVTGPLTSLHISTSWPRVYDSTTLLVEDTDYSVEQATGIVTLSSPRLVASVMVKSVRVVYLGGYATIPYDVERAAIELLAAKLFKGTAHQYHLTGVARDDGNVGGIRFDDMSPDTLDSLEKFMPRTL